MNKTILAGIACTSLLWFTATGCGEDTVLAGEDAGFVAIDLDFDPSPLKTDLAGQSRANAMEISKEDLSLKLTKTSDTSESPKTFTYAEFGDRQKVTIGQYLLEASYGTAGTEGWNLPYYYGSQSLTVKYNTETQVSLPVTLANSIVNISLSQGFTDCLSGYSISVTSASGNEYDWDDNAGRQLYLNPGNVMISVSFTKPNGLQATAQIDPFKAQARHRYNVTLDVDAGAINGETLNILIDDNIEEKSFDIDISDSNLPNLAPEPVIMLENMNLGQNISIVAGNTYSAPLKATIVARGKIASATLATTGALTTQGWPASVDLTNPGSAQATLESLGLVTRGLTGTSDVFGVIDLSKVVSNIRYIDGGDNTTTFSLTVTDENGASISNELFTVNVGELVLSILDGSEITSAGQASVLVNYNGENINDVKLSAKNSRGTWSDLSITDRSLIPDGYYTFSVSSAEITLDSNLTIKATTDKITSEEYIMHVPSIRLLSDQTNAFAKHAYASVRFTNDEAFASKADVKFEISTDGGNSFSQAEASLMPETTRASGEAVYKISGLNPSSTYTFRAKLSDETTAPAILSTESATQLLHPGFDEWTSEKKGDYQYLWIPESSWSTNNALTTSQSGSGSGNGLNTKGCSYKSTSAVIPANSRSTKSGDSGGAIGTSTSGDGNTVGNATLHSDKQKSGANAALIRTVGWGSGNTAKASGSGFGTCNNMTAGELFLGSYIDGNPVYGTAFTSRPAGISFFYHYDVVTPGNGDYGTVEVFLYSGNNVIATATKQLTEQNSYTPMSLDLDYTDLTQKATKISVIFKSSANADALNKSTTFWRCPGAKNTSGGEYIGSELYIDDIQLIY